jgi:hypothetical protein
MHRQTYKQQIEATKNNSTPHKIKQRTKRVLAATRLQETPEPKISLKNNYQKFYIIKEEPTCLFYFKNPKQ